MRQSQLKREAQKCGHGFYFGTTCSQCSEVEAAIKTERGACAAALVDVCRSIKVTYGRGAEKIAALVLMEGIEVILARGQK